MTFLNSIHYSLHRIYHLFIICFHYVTTIYLSISLVPLYCTGVPYPVQVMLNHLLWFKMAFTIFSFIYIIQHNCWHQSFQDFFSCFAFDCISLHSERYYALNIFFSKLNIITCIFILNHWDW